MSNKENKNKPENKIYQQEESKLTEFAEERKKPG
jgi:hypothetical protein